jgi:hypothetical protein
MSIVCDGNGCYIFTPAGLGTPLCKAYIYNGGLIYQSDFFDSIQAYSVGISIGVQLRPNIFYEMEYELYDSATQGPKKKIPKFPVVITCCRECYVGSGGSCQFISTAQKNCDTDEQYLFWAGTDFQCKDFPKAPDCPDCPDYSCDVGQVTTEPSTGTYACQSTNCPDGQYYSYPNGCLSFPCNTVACSSETIDNLCYEYTSTCSDLIEACGDDVDTYCIENICDDVTCSDLVGPQCKDATEQLCSKYINDSKCSPYQLKLLCPDYCPDVSFPSSRVVPKKKREKEKENELWMFIPFILLIILLFIYKFVSNKKLNLFKGRV